MSINTEMTALADAIRAKSGSTDKLSISAMTTAVTNIVINPGGDIDLTGVTVTADKMLEGIVAVGADGGKVTGTIETVEASRAQNVITVPKGYVSAEQEIAIPLQEVSISDYHIQLLEGYYLTQELSVATMGEISVEGNVVTIPVGYNTTAQTVTVGTAKAAQTYTPSTADQTIASGTYLSGVQTIKGDANLIADNIAEGIEIFGVTGTHQGGGNSDVTFGYINDDGKFQAIDLSVSPPDDVGNAVEASLVYFFIPPDPHVSVSSAGLTEYNTVYTMQTVDEETSPDFYATYFGSATGMIEFDITINRWVLREVHNQPIDYRAVITGLNGLTGQWEAVSDAAVAAVSVPVLTKLIDFELPEWNPQED